MKNKLAFKMLVVRLNSTNWEKNDVQTVKEVQNLCKIACNEKVRRYGRVVCVYQDGNLIAQGTASQLSKEMNVSSATIRKRADRGFIDVNGREFKFLEEK